MRKLQCALLGIFSAALASASAAEDAWHLLIEPTFMNYEAAWPIANAKSTVLVPARVVDGEVRPLLRSEILELKVNRKKILATAPGAASAVLATLKPRYVRDANKVIQYAVLESDSPLTASAVLAPEFAGLFTETLGPELIVAIPNRFRIFIFPRATFASLNISDLIFKEYHATNWPVTREIFALRKGKLITIGLSR
ncbi:MAG: hypothetical protein WCQ57_02250 [Verrucomicrobiota bacterium]